MMPKEPPPRNPIRKYQRKASAARRIGAGKKCACGESRPEALIKGSNPTICAACQRKGQGKSICDAHHVAGKSNSNATVPVPVNDHRAVLSPAQHDWPKDTLENPDGNPVLAAAASIRGFVDTLVYLMKELLLRIANMLETYNASMVEQHGPGWWEKTDLRKFTPRR
ncbi:MAG TPA: hypothetical protein VNJ52_04355 [Patescibacteria group bacterium]|nr:hypothetical protein [Patescibacteria group bacterium]